MSDQILLWVGFNIFVLAMLALDLGVFNRKAHAIEIREALFWSAIWIALALLFNLGLYLWREPDSALEFLTAYLLEKSLSVDNVFVFLLIFSYFRVPPMYQHKVLFWGILGALVMRAVFIVYTSNVFAVLGLRALYFALAGLMQLFYYLHYGLSAILVFVGAKMLLSDVYKISIGLALAIVAVILVASVVASLVRPRGQEIDLATGSAGQKAELSSVHLEKDDS